MTQTMPAGEARLLDRREAAQARADAMRTTPFVKARRLAPNDGERARCVEFNVTHIDQDGKTAVGLRAELQERDGKQFYRTDGYASTTEQPYEMWDFFGPYEEVVAASAFDKTLAANPDVMFLVNHRGLAMARTTTKTLELSVDSLGLRQTSWLNPERDDIRRLVSAISDKLITEMSFAFYLVDGEWSDDWMTFTILETDIDRGDVSAVNRGANPFTSIAARAREIMGDVMHLPVGAQRAALRRLEAKLGAPAAVPDEDGTQAAEPNNDVGDKPAAQPAQKTQAGYVGRSLTQIEAWLAVEEHKYD